MTLRRFDRMAGWCLRFLSMACFVALFFLLFINVIARTFQLAGFAWFDEIVQGLFAWMVFAGAAALWREREHFSVDWLEVTLGQSRYAILLRALISLLCLCFLMAMTIYGFDLYARSRALTPILQLPTSLFYIVIPLSGLVMVVYTLRDITIAFSDLLSHKRKQNHDL